MGRLFLLRHAKADWAEPGMRDFDRTLAEGGIQEATLMGKAMRERGIIPDNIICSSAKRAVQTLDAIDQNNDWEKIASFQEKLYSTDAPGYLEVASESGLEGDLMLIGHNPMLEDLALGLGQNGNDEAYSQISMGFGTAALAIICYQGPVSEIQTAKCALEDYIRPRDL